jgi:hypothetical protein
MVLGALKAPADQLGEITTDLRAIKKRFGLSSHAEVKWGKISPKWQPLYEALIGYFFDQGALSFRGIVADKTALDHDAFSQTHDDWYYKMYYLLLAHLLDREDEFRIYLDIKDTRGGPKVRKLEEVLRSGVGDHSDSVVNRVQTVRSHEVQALQLADVLLGAVSYGNRSGGSSRAKRAVASLIESRSGSRFRFNTPANEEKFNLFHWHGRAGGRV